LISDVIRLEYGRVMAHLVGRLGDIQLAEDALQDAIERALIRWPTDGVPANPRAWLVTTAKRRGIDLLRGRNVRTNKAADVGRLDRLLREERDLRGDVPDIEDERLRLIFTCCHPVLPMPARVALTLRTVCGLTTDEIARAFLVTVPTMAQRLVRAKKQIQQAGIPYEVPAKDELSERLDAVLAVVYLVFSEGYAATSGEALIRHDLCEEAIRLGHVLVDLADEAEALGLLGLMYFTHSRRLARMNHQGCLVPLDEQDRRLWDPDHIAAGQDCTQRALSRKHIGPYQLQAAIAGIHSTTPRADMTPWGQIVIVYGRLFALNRSPVVALNRAVAVGMAQGPEKGLGLLDELATDKRLRHLHLLHAARADFHRRLGDLDQARSAYTLALAGTESEPERRFLNRRLAEINDPDPPR
jgi:RNA polymerase sigma-70 factor, ECF subfamily